MRIRCPSCSATYEVADALLDRPRTVRCAQCAHDWVAEPIIEPTLAETAAETPPEPVRAAVPLPESPVHEPEPQPVFGDTPLSAIERLAAPVDLSPRLRRHDRLLTTAWAASFAILAALGVAGYTQRNRLMQEWPASKRVYATLGLIPADIKSPDAKGSAAPPAQ